MTDSSCECRRGGRISGFFSFLHWEGPTNWFSESPRGSWSGGFGDIDDIEVPLMMLFGFLGFIWLATSGYPVTGLAYIGMLVASYIGYASNYVNKDIPTEYLGGGCKSCFWQYARIGAIIAVLWMALYVVLIMHTTNMSITQSIFSIKLQDIFLLSTGGPVSLKEVVALAIIQIFLVAQVEASFLGAWLLPTFTQKIGVVPSVILISGAGTLLHMTSIITPIQIIMCFMFGLMTYPFVLAYRSKQLTAIPHYIVNACAFILPSLIPILKSSLGV